MSWIDKNKKYWRIALALLMLGAWFGPWTYYDDGVPPPEWCDDRFILLHEDEGDTCVQLVTGATLYSWSVPNELPIGMVSGEFGIEQVPPYSLAFCFLSLPFLPFLGALLLTRIRDNRSARVFAFLMWGLGATNALLIITFDRTELPPWSFWGIWLNIGLAAFAITLEILVWKAGSTPR